MTIKLEGKIAIVIGTSSIIGETRAIALAAKGVTVVFADRLQTLTERGNSHPNNWTRTLQQLA